MQCLIAVFTPLAVGVLIIDWRSQSLAITHSPLGGCTLGCMFGWDVTRVGRSSGWRFSFSVILSLVPVTSAPRRKRSQLLSGPNENNKQVICRGFFGGWRSVRLDGAHVRWCMQTQAHVCIAVLTGRGSSSLSSVFISDGCTPLRLTPYATQKRLCTINQTSRVYTQNYMHRHSAGS